MKTRLSIFVLGMTIASGPSALAQTNSGAEFTKEMKSATTTMHQGMGMESEGGNPDRHFASMMIPHHQGAIDMARAYLKVGKDPEIRKMAEKVIKDQEKEIGEFTAWIKKHPDSQSSH